MRSIWKYKDRRLPIISLFRFCSFAAGTAAAAISLSSIADAPDVAVDRSTTVVVAAIDPAEHENYDKSINADQFFAPAINAADQFFAVSPSKAKKEIGVPSLLRTKSTMRLQHRNQFVHS